MIKVIHISDFHLENETPSFSKVEITNALMKDLHKYVCANTVLFFTGDLIDKGGLQFKEKGSVPFERFQDVFLNRILESFPQLKGRIFITPGNHDVYREKIDPVAELGLKGTLTDEKQLNAFIESNRASSKYLDRLEDYKKWERQFYAEYNNCVLSNFENSFKLKLADHHVGITAINSSWLCKDENDKHNLLIGRSQIETSLNFINDCDVKLTLAHHPLEFLNEFDYSEIGNTLYSKYDAYFAGHVHTTDSSYIQNLFGSIFFSIANATIADNSPEKKYVNGYSIVEIYPNDRVKVTYRKYVDEHHVFVPNTDIGTEDGTNEYFLLKYENLKKFEEAARIVVNISNLYSEKLNDHLIMSSNNTEVDCSIESVFVEPTILNCPNRTFKEDDTKSYTVDSILSQDSSFLIYGVKEAGKTILLDKFFLDATKKFNQLSKIPVLLKFNELRGKTIEKIIREFLGISAKEIDSFIKANKLVVLIDDLTFNAKGEEIISSLKQFCKQYPSVQIIATSSMVLDNIIPTDYLQHNDVFHFELGFIQSLNSDQIKQFISKWFAGKEVDLQESMEKLIKNFSDFGLPRTPLSVTLFLWIFEKQEKRPINNSVLVEMFVENLLEKTNIENIYRETFDFKNKQRLLSFVARYMHDKGDSDKNYSVDYVSLLTYVDSYLKTRFPGQPQKVLDDLIKRGVLTHDEENTIRFKSAFFFHYFLSLQFDYDSMFKSFVFTDENYLSYTEEIAYYTGLKRDDFSILNFTQERLDEAFRELNQKQYDDYKRVDEVLEPNSKNDAISYRIDGESIKNKPSDEDVNEIYDEQLAAIPVQKTIEKKEPNIYQTKKNIDSVLKLASIVLKNSEDVDDFGAKSIAYKNVLVSSISFLMVYRDYLIGYYNKFKKQPENFPKNIDFSLFIKIMPLINQVVLYDWLGSQKLRPVIVDKMEKDLTSLNTSEYEKFLSIFIYGDVKGADYPKKIESFVKNAKYSYTKDLSFLKILSYYHLRSKNPELDKFYLKLLADIREDLGILHKRNKDQFKKEIEDAKKKQ